MVDHRTVGWEYARIAIDDGTRLAFVQGLATRRCHSRSRVSCADGLSIQYNVHGTIVE